MVLSNSKFTKSRNIFYILFTLFLVVVFCETTLSKTKYFIPKLESSSDSTFKSNSEFRIHLWCMQNSSPKMFTAYLKIFVSDSVQIDLQNPQFKSNRGMLTFDALSMWRMADSSADQVSILIISGFTNENAHKAKISLEAGVYVAQMIFFFEFHPKIKIKDKSRVVSLGQIQFGDEKVILNNIQLFKSSSKKLMYYEPPDSSRIR